jgi:octaprenyl-diphosphate synthase
MVDGEFLQLRYAGDPAVSEKQYFAVVQRKTALLMSATCEIGALYGGAHPVEQKALSSYGQKIGVAFQIIDDLLDYLGDEKATGKVVGNDFIEGKMTLPLIHTLAQSTETDKADLLKALQKNPRDRNGCALARQRMHATESFAFSRQRAAQEIGEGLAALSCFSEEQHPESLAIVKKLAGYILSRDR